MDFLVRHKLINPSQHGFLKARSFLTNLLCFFEKITKWVDDGVNSFNVRKTHGLLFFLALSPMGHSGVRPTVTQ